MKEQSLLSKHERVMAAYCTIAVTIGYYAQLKMLIYFMKAPGDMTGVTDENGHKTSFAYDALGRMIGMCNALNQCESYHYNAAGQMDSTTNRRGQTISFTYDMAGRLKTKSYSGYSASFTYDLSGNPLTASDGNGTVSYAYEAAQDRVSSVSFSGAGMPSYTTSYGYDDEDNVTSSTGPNGATGYLYDVAGRLMTITSPAGAFSFGYYDRGLVKSMAYPNGVVANYGFDAAGQLTLLENKKGASAVSSFAYHYDADGNRDVITDSAGAHAYGYDVLDQLTSADHPAAQSAYNPDESYLYDPVGNRVRTHLSSIHVVNALNQLLEDDKYKYEYDADGNLNKKTEKAVPANVTTYTFNPENQLTRVDMSGAKFAEFKYDVLGRRIEVNDNGAITRFAYDIVDLAAEYNASNVLVNTYVYGPGIDNILARKQGATTLFYHKDALQSVIALTNVSGDVVQSYKYDSFGNIVSSTGSVTDNRITYSGREWDKAIGLYNYRARYYNARAGLFISEDPKWNNNLNTYVRNRPNILVDPTGNVGYIIFVYTGKTKRDQITFQALADTRQRQIMMSKSFNAKKDYVFQVPFTTREDFLVAWNSTAETIQESVDVRGQEAKVQWAYIYAHGDFGSLEFLPTAKSMYSSMSSNEVYEELEIMPFTENANMAIHACHSGNAPILSNNESFAEAMSKKQNVTVFGEDGFAYDSTSFTRYKTIDDISNEDLRISNVYLRSYDRGANSVTKSPKYIRNRNNPKLLSHFDIGAQAKTMIRFPKPGKPYYKDEIDSKARVEYK